MNTEAIVQKATEGLETVPQNWMRATGVRPMILGDPALVWLEYHGKEHGFEKDTSPYDFLPFVGDLGNRFEDKCIAELAPQAARVCPAARDVTKAEHVRTTIEMMAQRVPVITQAALWWAPERIYGSADLIVLKSWLVSTFPQLATAVSVREGASPDGDYYVVMDCKFSTSLEAAEKQQDYAMCAGQVRIYSYILGKMQGLLPSHAYLITREDPYKPVAVPIESHLGQSLDKDLAILRDRFVEIKVNGANYLPWRDQIVEPNFGNKKDEPWTSAKRIIAHDKTPGRDLSILVNVGNAARRKLHKLGITSLDQMLAMEPKDVPLESVSRLSRTNIDLMRAILQANRSGSPVYPAGQYVPAERRCEIYVDYEFFSNINVDFERQWPSLQGREMVFMVGALTRNLATQQLDFQVFIAEEESQEAELAMMQKFLGHLNAITTGAYMDPSKTAIYHWTPAEVWQSKRVARRHRLPQDHPLFGLPWVDLHKAFKEGGAALPGAWGYGIKGIAKSLAKLDEEFDPHWPDDLADGLRAQVMGWKAYQNEHPVLCDEMKLLEKYLRADCVALYQVLRYMRLHHR